MSLLLVGFKFWSLIVLAISAASVDFWQFAKHPVASLSPSCQFSALQPAENGQLGVNIHLPLEHVRRIGILQFGSHLVTLFNGIPRAIDQSATETRFHRQQAKSRFGNHAGIDVEQDLRPRNDLTQVFNKTCGTKADGNVFNLLRTGPALHRIALSNNILAHCSREAFA